MSQGQRLCSAEEVAWLHTRQYEGMLPNVCDYAGQRDVRPGQSLHELASVALIPVLLSTCPRALTSPRDGFLPTKVSGLRFPSVLHRKAKHSALGRRSCTAQQSQYAELPSLGSSRFKAACRAATPCTPSTSCSARRLTCAADKINPSTMAQIRQVQENLNGVPQLHDLPQLHETTSRKFLPVVQKAIKHAEACTSAQARLFVHAISSSIAG